MVTVSLFLFCVFYILAYAFAQDPVANLPQGRIIGIKVYVKNSLVPIEIYYGVPYAIPPVGRFRFSAPEKHPGWKRTFFAHRLPPTCPQTSDGDNNYFSEDCLFLNIWTPKSGDGSMLPVVVILYSESWLEGGVSLPCQELAADGVVVVTVNYRHHILAYFTLGSPSARGNLALLDQYLALVWIRENIAAFGGDPNTITLFGHSAGADSVLYHMGSNRAQGLYKRAIIISPRDVWKVLDNANNLNATVSETVSASREIALVLGCTGAVDEDILRCMRSRPLADIVSLYLNSNWSRFMRPVPDIYLPETEQYLPTSLSTALSSSKQSIVHLDLILGTNDLESINYNERTYEELIKRGEGFISNFTDSNLIPKILRLLSLDREESLMVQTQAIRWEYWRVNQKNSIDQSIGAIESYARIESSGKWGVGVGLLAARLARQVSRLYVYRYSQPGVNLLGQNLNFSGAVHGVDLVSLLGDTMMLQVSRRPASLEERELSLIFRKHLIQFIRSGSPSGNEWQRYRPGDAHVYDFCNEKSFIGYSRDLSFWLQYLPHLTNMATCSYPEQFTYEKGDNNRLRSGVFAFSGLTAVLVLLLIASAFLLRKQFTRRLSITKL